MKIKILIVLALVFISSTAHARPRRRSRNYTYTNNTSYTSYTSYKTNSEYMNGTDQEKCQAEADYMAEKHICGHVWGVIGRFEGIGYGFRPDCNTCTPGNSGMVCTGDASAMGANGMWYRVRSWR